MSDENCFMAKAKRNRKEAAFLLYITGILFVLVICCLVLCIFAKLANLSDTAIAAGTFLKVLAVLFTVSLLAEETAGTRFVSAFLAVSQEELDALSDEEFKRLYDFAHKAARCSLRDNHFRTAKVESTADFRHSKSAQYVVRHGGSEIRCTQYELIRQPVTRIEKGSEQEIRDFISGLKGTDVLGRPFRINDDSFTIFKAERNSEGAETR